MKNPFRNALLALGYIISLVSLVFLTPRVLGAPEESIFYPMVMLSLLVLSVAVMAFLFFYQPLVFILEGKRDEAVRFFLRSLATFAVGIFGILLCALLFRF